MSLFRYEAVDRSGKIVMGAMDAPSEADVNARLAHMGYQPQKVMPTAGASRQVSGAKVTAALSPQPSTLNPQQSDLGGVKPKELALFYRQFAALVRSGISLYEAMNHLAPQTPQPALAQTAREMAEAAHTGGRVSDVMERYSRIYAPHVVASVRAGELGGFLDIVLDEIALNYEQEIAFYKGIWLMKALLIQGVLAIAIAQPFFQKLFATDKARLENYSIGEQMREFLILVVVRNLPIALALLLLVKLWLNWLQRPEQRERRDRWMLRLPAFGDLARQHALAAFVRMLRRLFAAGLSPIQAWEGAMNVAPNTVIRRRLVDSYALVRGGNMPIHEAFRATGLFASEAEQLLATGVVSGQMVDMLDRVAEYYQGNVDRAYSNARFWMFRLAIIGVILLTGILLIVLVKTYFTAVFDNPLVRPD
jgi:type IV pilus assembly protein PilC